MSDTELKVTIKFAEEYTDATSIGYIYGQGANYPTGLGVDGFHVNYVVNITIGDDSRDFNITAQSLERSDNIMAYNGYDMALGSLYGADDDTSKLVAFLEEYDYSDDEVIGVIEEDAENRCREYLHNNAGDVLNDISIQETILNEMGERYDLMFETEESLSNILETEINNFFEKYIDDYDGFTISDNPDMFNFMLDEVENMKENQYLDFLKTTREEIDKYSETSLDELKPLLADEEQHGLLFGILIEKAKAENKTNNGIYVQFVCDLEYMITGKEPTPVNVWYIEQNDMKPSEEKESIEALCYDRYYNTIELAPENGYDLSKFDKTDNGNSIKP